MKVEELIARQEGKTLEFKQDLSSHSNIIKTITAFANTAGGTLLIGIEDKSKALVGISEPLDNEERLASMVVDSIESRLVPNIEIINWKERNLLAVEVYPSSLRPHHIKVLGPEKGTFVRIVSTNRQADGPLRKELTRWAGDRSFDEEPMPEINPEAIDFRVVFRLDDKDQRIITLISESIEDGGATQKYLSEKLGISTRAMSSRLMKLVEAGYIVVIQKNIYDPKKRYLPVQED